MSPSTATQGTPIAVRRVESQYTDFVHTVRALPHGEAGWVVVCTEAGIQIWDKQALHLLFVWSFPPEAATPQGSGGAAGVGTTQGLFARGAAVAIAADGSSHVVFGASTGELYVVEADESGRFRAPAVFSHHKAPITAVATAYQSRQGRWTEDMGCQVVVADESGAISVWVADSAASYRLAERQPAVAANVPAVSLAVRSDFIVAARLDGSVQVISLRDGKLRAEFAAHSRWLTCMDIHPTKDIVATGAEDGTICVWTLPIGAQKTTALLSCVWMHAAVAGTAFCGPTFDDVAAVAYDTDELQLYKLARPT